MKNLEETIFPGLGSDLPKVAQPLNLDVADQEYDAQEDAKVMEMLDEAIDTLEQAGVPMSKIQMMDYDEIMDLAHDIVEDQYYKWRD
jgi:hypothetical protein